MYGFDFPDSVSSNGTYVWVTNYEGASVTVVHASTGSLAGVGGSGYGFDFPDGVSSSGSRTWVTNAGLESVTEIQT